MAKNAQDDETVMLLKQLLAIELWRDGCPNPRFGQASGSE
jgi:hypothetical protein